MKLRKVRVAIAVGFILVGTVALIIVSKPKKTIVRLDEKVLEMYETVTLSMLESVYDLEITNMKSAGAEETLESLDGYQSIEKIDSYENVNLYLYTATDVYHAPITFSDSKPPILLINGKEVSTAELTLKEHQRLSEVLEIRAYDVRGDNQVDLESKLSHDIDESYSEDFELSVQVSDGFHEVSTTIKVTILKEAVAQGSQSIHTISREAFDRIDVLVNKTHVMDESYIPTLSEFPAKYAVSEGYRARPEAMSAFIEMVNAMNAETGLWMYVTSSYRDYEFQGRLYRNSVASMGLEKASMLSAKPGASEHQTGLAIDVVTQGVSMYDFGTTQQSQWVNENAHRYGFIVRYQEAFIEETGYNAEPWHLRYLGKDLAQKVYESGLSYEKYRGL